MTLHVHDLMPMFTASRLDGTVVHYQDIWQRQNLLLVALPPGDATGAAYATSLRALEPRLPEYDASAVVTTTRIDGVPAPGVVVADRWGEVYHVKAAEQASQLPSPEELVDWLRYVQIQCPECQGETR
jgi:hypothetical protein